MSALMILKIFSDCCVYFALVCSGPVEFEIPVLILALACALPAGIAAFCDRKGWPVLRCICAALPFLCLLPLNDGTQTMIIAAPAAYTAFAILRGKLALEYSEYRHFFIRSLILLGIAYVVANIWSFLAMITGEAKFLPDAGVILRYSLVHLFCGVVLQRQLRLGAGNHAEGGRRQMATLLGTMGTIAVGLSLAEPLLRRGVGVLIRQLVSLLLLPFVFLLDLAAELIAKLKRADSDDKDLEQFLEYWEKVITGGNFLGGNNNQTPEPINIDGAVVWTVLIVLLLLVVAIWLWRTFRKIRADLPSGEQVSRVLQTPKKKKTSTLTNRGRVRQLYREFLRTEKNLGLKLRASDTSGDVLARVHKNTHRESAAELRQVYLAARYDDRQNISRSQVEQAKQALRGSYKKDKLL